MTCVYDIPQMIYSFSNIQMFRKLKKKYHATPDILNMIDEFYLEMGAILHSDQL